jgi:probable selenium-dependent hydroxylase accessory protein YqeC
VETFADHFLPGDNGVISLVGAGGKTTLMFHLARELSSRGDPTLTTTTTKIYCPAQDQWKRIFVSDDPAELSARIAESVAEFPHVMAAKAVSPDRKKLIGLDPTTVDRLAAGSLFRWILVEADGAARRPLKAPAVHEPVIPRCSRQVVAVAGLDAVGMPLGEDWVHRPGEYSRLTGLAEGTAITPESVAEVLRHPEGIFKGSPTSAQRTVFLNKGDVAERIEAGRFIAAELVKTAKGIVHRILIGSLLPVPCIIEAIDV